MNRKIIFSATGIMLLVATACGGTSRIIRHDKSTAVIQGRNMSKADAMKAAEKRATDLFGRFKELKPADCQIGYTSDINNVSGGIEYGEGHVHWDCVIYVEKIN